MMKHSKYDNYLTVRQGDMKGLLKMSRVDLASLAWNAERTSQLRVPGNPNPGLREV